MKSWADGLWYHSRAGVLGRGLRSDLSEAGVSLPLLSPVEWLPSLLRFSRLVTNEREAAAVESAVRAVDGQQCSYVRASARLRDSFLFQFGFSCFQWDYFFYSKLDLSCACLIWKLHKHADVPSIRPTEQISPKLFSTEKNITPQCLLLLFFYGYIHQKSEETPAVPMNLRLKVPEVLYLWSHCIFTWNVIF